MTIASQYVGVAAPSTSAEVATLVRSAIRVGFPDGTRFMSGPLVSRKSLMGRPVDTPSRYPEIGDIPGLMYDSSIRTGTGIVPEVWNVIHFNSRDPRLYKQLVAISALSPLVGGIQLNIAWPCPEQLALFRDMFPKVQLILQIGNVAFDAIDRNPFNLVECLKPYEDTCEYVLFDPSGGLGRSFDVDEASEVLSVLVGSRLDMAWGVTGGLCAEDVHRLAPLLDIYPQLSWDAEGRLRIPETDTLDLSACRRFLGASASLLCSRSIES